LGIRKNVVAATYCQAESELFGLIVLFVLPLKSAANMVIKLMPGTSGELGEMECSVLIELGNIITGSYLTLQRDIFFIDFFSELCYSSPDA